jgi:heme exporter protein A
MNAEKDVSGIRLRVESLSLTRGEATVLNGISFAVKSGGALLVTGPNGAGKTSLLLALAGFLRAAGGTIELTGLAKDSFAREAMHYVGHAPAIKNALGVAENLRFWSGLLGGGDVMPALEAAGLGPLAHMPAGFLSAGQARRLALARLVAIPRPLWLLDEPTGTLDEQGAAWVNRMIALHLEGGGLAVIATHLPLGLSGAVETLALAPRRAA